MYKRIHQTVEIMKYNRNNSQPQTFYSRSICIDLIYCQEKSCRKQNEWKQKQPSKNRKLSGRKLKFHHFLIAHYSEEHTKSIKNPQGGKIIAHFKYELRSIVLCIKPTKINIVSINVEKSRTKSQIFYIIPAIIGMQKAINKQGISRLLSYLPFTIEAQIENIIRVFQSMDDKSKETFSTDQNIQKPDVFDDCSYVFTKMGLSINTCKDCMRQAMQRQNVLFYENITKRMAKDLIFLQLTRQINRTVSSAIKDKELRIIIMIAVGWLYIQSCIQIIIIKGNRFTQKDKEINEYAFIYFVKLITNTVAILIVSSKKLYHMNMKKQQITPAENNDYTKQIKLNNIVNAILEQSKSSSKVNSQIDALVELAIWAQKKSPESLLSILEMGIIEQIVILQGNAAIDQIKTATMLFGNCVDSGILAHYLLKIKFGNLILKNAIISFHQKGAQKNEQLIQYLANYMKMYVKHFNKQTEEFFFEGQRCLLAQVCCRFYNFPDQIARTTVMNIIMHIMKTVGEQSFEEKVDNRIQTFFKPWATSLAVQFRNQLIKFNKEIGKCNNFAEIKDIILQINDKIILWEDLVALAPHLFRQIFFKQILQPIIVGSMSNSTKLSLIFTLKFSLVMLGKMINILKKLHLLQELGTVIFYSLSFTVEKRCLKTISLDSFNTLTLNDEQFIDPYHGEPQQQQQKIQFGEIYQFFLTVIKSKDDQFLKIVCHLLRVLFQEVKTDKKSLLYFEEKLQLSVRTNNTNFNLIVDILLSQLNSMHSLNTLKEISQCIITYLNSYHLQQDLKVRFVYSFQNAIHEAYESLNSRENIDYIIQIFQYDLKNIEQWNIQTETLNKLQEMNQQLQFLSEPFSMENIQQSPFYEIIPDTPQGTTRYKFCKFLLFRKLNSLATENQSNVQQINLVQTYNRKLLYSDGRLLKPASLFPLPLKQPNHPCRLIDNKQDLHTLLIDDERFFILGFIQKNQVKILMNLKIKHLKNEVKIKNDKTVLEIYVTAYNPVKQDLFAKSSFYLKGFQLGRYYIPMRYQRIKDAEISFISRLLNKAKSQLPEISLI